MNDIIVREQSEDTEKSEAAKASSTDNKLGSLEIEIREIKVPHPVRAINRMWPNR